MCGEVEDERQNDDEIVARLLYIGGNYGVTRETLTARTAPPLASDDARPAYMADLFRRVLNHAVSDLYAIPEGYRADTIANQAVVFARLAGFLAAHVSLQEDPLRKVIEALMHGYAEAEEIEPDHGHDHGHDHDHDHEHGHHRHTHAHDHHH